MLFNSINFWRLTSLALFAAVLVLLFPWLGLSPDFELETAEMQLVDSPTYGARFTFTVRNDGDAGDARVTCHLYLFERGGDTESDHIVIGVEGGQSKSGELFIPLPQGQTVHDWRVDVD
ncbi:MAG: hypothetical protein C4534_07000 [Gaiellales bacterium]|nr:MAG: hypothetical protein C4534_07000 [Gaiellales bacterium]